MAQLGLLPLLLDIDWRRSRSPWALDGTLGYRLLSTPRFGPFYRQLALIGNVSGASPCLRSQSPGHMPASFGQSEDTLQVESVSIDFKLARSRTSWGQIVSRLARTLCVDAGDSSLCRTSCSANVCSFMLRIAALWGFHLHIDALYDCSLERTLDDTYHMSSRTRPNDRKVSIRRESDVDLVPFQAWHPPSPIAQTDIKRVNNPEEEYFRALVVIFKAHFL